MAALAPYVAGDCLVGIDAPLVVAQPDGQPARRGRAQPGLRALRRRRAPVNTGKPEFARAAARRPAGRRGSASTSTRRSTARRRADRGLPARRDGGAVPARPDAEVQEQAGPDARAAARAELLRAHAAARGAGRRRRRRCASPAPSAWQALVEPVRGGRAQERPAPRRGPGRRGRVRLRRAVRRTPARAVTTYGDAATGSISRRRCPPDHVPVAARSDPPVEPPRPTADPVRRAVQTFAALQPRAARGHRPLRRPGHHAARRRRHQLPQRQRPRQERRVVRGQGRPDASTACRSTPTRWSEITDQIGVRVITYLHSDVTAVADLLSDQLAVLDDRDMGQETASEGRFGYASRHLLVALDGPDGAARTTAAAPGPGPGAHRAAARLGGVRARDPLQGHHPGRARPRPRPAVHAGRRAAGARRPGVHR